MEKALLGFGMKRDRVEIVAEEQQAVDRALKMAKRDDLVLIFADKINRTWKQITKFMGEEGSGSKRPPAPSSTFLLDGEPEANKLDGVALVRDERGVRLARELESED